MYAGHYGGPPPPGYGQPGVVPPLGHPSSQQVGYGTYGLQPTDYGETKQTSPALQPPPYSSVVPGSPQGKETTEDN